MHCYSANIRYYTSNPKILAFSDKHPSSSRLTINDIATMATQTCNIVVQPPSQVQKNNIIYPPVVVSCPPNDPSLFFQVVVFDAQGSVLEAQFIGGTVLNSAHSLRESSTSGSGSASGSASASGSGSGSGGGSSSQSAQTDFVAFPDLYINKTGTFLIQVNVLKIDYGVSPQASCIEQLNSRPFRVRSSTTGLERGCMLFLPSYSIFVPTNCHDSIFRTKTLASSRSRWELPHPYCLVGMMALARFTCLHHLLSWKFTTSVMVSGAIHGLVRSECVLV